MMDGPVLETVVYACVAYWAVAIASVALRSLSPRFGRMAAYGRVLEIHDGAPGFASNFFQPCVAKATAFQAFYALGSIVCAGAMIAVAVEGTRAQLHPAMWMLFFHLQRRLWESLVLQTMSGYTTPFAAMAGLSFYVYVPVSVVAAAHSTSTGWKWTAAVYCFAVGQAGQFWTHTALECWKARNGGGHRPVPRTELPFAISPVLHYRCEVLIYVGIALSCTNASWLLLIPLFTHVNLRATAKEAGMWERRLFGGSK
jgi:hypothetical protein